MKEETSLKLQKSYMLPKKIVKFKNSLYELFILEEILLEFLYLKLVRNSIFYKNLKSLYSIKNVRISTTLNNVYLL